MLDSDAFFCYLYMKISQIFRIGSRIICTSSEPAVLLRQIFIPLLSCSRSSLEDPRLKQTQDASSDNRKASGIHPIPKEVS
jgi:hypothetical protein